MHKGRNRWRGKCLDCWVLRGWHQIHSNGDSSTVNPTAMVLNKAPIPSLRNQNFQSLFCFIFLQVTSSCKTSSFNRSNQWYLFKREIQMHCDECYDGNRGGSFQHDQIQLSFVNWKVQKRILLLFLQFFRWNGWRKKACATSVVKMSTFWESLLNHSSHVLLPPRTTIPFPLE